MRILIILLLMPIIVMAKDKKNSNSLSPQTLTVSCPQNVTISEGQKYDTAVTGFPKVLSNDGGAVTITYLEIFSKGNCANGNDLVSRIFTIRNVIGDIERCTQNIFIRHLTTTEVYIPKDTTIEYPKDKSFTQTLLGLPVSLGSLDITFIDTKVSNLCTIPIRIKREWSLKDKCSSDIVKKTTNITIISYQNSFDHNKSIVTDLCNNEGEITLTPKGEFGPYTYMWSNNATTNSILNLTAGNYSVIITDKFKCNQLNTTTLSNISETGDIGGLISTEANYRVNPDSIYITDVDNIAKFCASSNGGIHYAFKVKSKKIGFTEYRFVKRSQVLDGVSTKDIVLIQKHVLGKKLLEDTLRYFAADVNNNFSVSASDVSEIRKLILGIKDNFTNVLPWYFFRPDWKSVITKNNSYESIFFKGVNIVNYPRLNADVLAVKMGDVDLSYNNTLSELDKRSIELIDKVYLNYSMSQIKDWVEIPIFLHKSNVGIEGMQFAINIPEHCGSAEVQSGILNSEYFQLKNNKLKVSWSTGDVLEFNEQIPLLTIKIKLYNDNCSISEQIRLDKNFTNEFYTGESLVENAFVMNALNSNYSNQFELMPNPAHNYFSITSAKELEGASIEVYQLDGKFIYSSSLHQYLEVNTSKWIPTTYFYIIKNSLGSQLQQGSLIVQP
ncbi:MAG: hypothetical protein ABI851_01665 [Saprospiraceae bacterium]